MGRRTAKNEARSPALPVPSRRKSRNRFGDKKTGRIDPGKRHEVLTKAGVNPYHYRRSEGALNRFADAGTLGFVALADDPKRFRKRGGARKMWPVKTTLDAIRMYNRTRSICTVSDELGVPYFTVKHWVRQRFLPKTGPYRFERMMALVAVARNLYLVSSRDPVGCIYHALNRFPEMRWRAIKVYLYLEAMPTIPGFPLYADRKVNLAAERYGLGLRRYGHALGIEHPDIPAEAHPSDTPATQTAPASKPRQKGRTFLVEGRVTSLIPALKRNLPG